MDRRPGLASAVYFGMMNALCQTESARLLPSPSTVPSATAVSHAAC